MLFVRALISGLFEGPAADVEFRHRLRDRAAAEGTAGLYRELQAIDPQAAERIHPNDLRRIERALEVYHLTGRPISALQTQWAATAGRYDCRLIALRREREDANRRINRRVERMVEQGLVDEVRALLADSRGIGQQAAQAVGYAEIIAYLRGELPLDEAVERIKINTRHLAKHQRTWMRRLPNVHWIDVAPDDTVESVAERVLRHWQNDASAL